MPFTYDEATTVADDARELDEAELEAFAGGKVGFSGGIGVGVCKELGGGAQAALGDVQVLWRAGVRPGDAGPFHASPSLMYE